MKIPLIIMYQITDSNVFNVTFISEIRHESLSDIFCLLLIASFFFFLFGCFLSQARFRSYTLTTNPGRPSNTTRLQKAPTSPCRKFSSIFMQFCIKPILVHFILIHILVQYKDMQSVLFILV